MNSSDHFTILADGTKDKSHNEILLSIGVRYVKEGISRETIVDFQFPDDLSAETTANVMLSTLRARASDEMKLISQCYDGANVMSGHKGGVQTIIIQRALDRPIPYLHCFNHRLHLVVIHAIERLPIASNFCDELNLLYKSKSYVKEPTWLV